MSAKFPLGLRPDIPEVRSAPVVVIAERDDDFPESADLPPAAQGPHGTRSGNSALVVSRLKPEIRSDDALIRG